MFTNTDEEFAIGQEIIGNIDENGYLKTHLEEIARALNVPLEKVENTLKIIQQFDPAGVAARTISECLLIQLELSQEKDPLLRKIVENHLEDVAKKNYSQIAKTLKEPLEKIEPLIQKILKLDPKPGRNYSLDENQRIIPDIIINEKDEELEISINNEDIPSLNINKAYKEMLKNDHLEPGAKEFLVQKMRNALELLRAISKRKFTLRKIVEAVVEIQQDAIKEDLSYLKPLTFKDVAMRLNLHESTVCRAVMNKYVELPGRIVALKNFFLSHSYEENGQFVSSNRIKKLIKEFIEQEDKKQPVSDQDIVAKLKENNLAVSRRTVAKYRDELKILSSTFRRQR
jgi:RNA polymerase sigma-54 factor